jgi:hypothetical protein
MDRKIQLKSSWHNEKIRTPARKENPKPVSPGAGAGAVDLHLHFSPQINERPKDEKVKCIHENRVGSGGFNY